MEIIQGIVKFWEQIISVLSTFRIKDLIDIGIVAFILYSILKLLRDTRAVQLVKGIFLIFFLYLSAKILDMQAVTYLLEMLFDNIIIVIVILFQSEIRHALESVGRKDFNFTIFSGKNSENIKKINNFNIAINATVKACSEMREKKIGALIVFENKIMLGEVIATGTELDAVVSEEILTNIFYPKSPLHDGATIIRDSRICAAACILPLSQNSEISNELGTRHRAAIGVTEISDAIVVVLSEETGHISVATNGFLERNISESKLREKLTNYLIGDEITTSTDSTGIKKFLGGFKK